MDEFRINSIIYRVGACLIVSSLLMSAVSAHQQISKYRSNIRIQYKPEAGSLRSLVLLALPHLFSDAG